jgi:tripartite-type tricarboxylate transporter receptor subunit TctC
MAGVGFRARAAWASLSLALVCAPAAAQTPPNFYAGKTITIVVGFSAGGGYDQYARLLARHLGHHIPGRPEVIVQNLPGAGSLNAVRQLEATQLKDGTVITTFNPALINDSLMSPEKVKFNFAEAAWIGSMSPDVRVCYMWHTTGVKTWAEMLARREVVLGSTARGTGAYVNGAILQNLFGVRVKNVLGFPGGAEQRIALERGELDADCGSWSSVPPEWINEKKIHPIVTFSPGEVADLPKSVPFIGSFATTQEQKDILEVLTATGDLGRPFIMSKAVPADRIAMVRAAFVATMKDPQFLAEAQRQQLPIHPTQGEKAGEIIERIYRAPPAIVAKAKIAIE